MTKQERLEQQRIKLAEMRAHEDELRASGVKYIAGIDEVGRGPLAGPVYAACVIMPEDWDILGVNDSKKLSAKKREELDVLIREKAVAYGIGISDNKAIDEMNILNATKAAMLKAVEAANAKLPEGESIDCLLIDAVHLDSDIRQESIIKGDEKSLSIAAASIVAKVARDNYMIEMDEQYPGYDFASNKGYGTAAHYEGLRTFGMTPIHRRTFLKKFEEAEMAKKKYYAVKRGRDVGIFESWESCKRSVDGFSGAEYKSFADIEDAQAYLGWKENPGAKTKAAGEQLAFSETEACISGVCAYVDGSYDVASGRYSGGAVIVDGDSVTELKQAYNDGDQSQLRNVAGEIMGARLAVDYCISKGYEAVTIYHDYEGVGKWGDNLWKANLEMTQSYKAYIADARKKIAIKFVKVKAHAGNKYNEMADKLAKNALDI